MTVAATETDSGSALVGKLAGELLTHTDVPELDGIDHSDAGVSVARSSDEGVGDYVVVHDPDGL